MKTIHAIYENGVFRPTDEVELPERTLVEFEPRPVGPSAVTDGVLDQVYAILEQRFESGSADTAARHNEHQP